MALWWMKPRDAPPAQGQHRLSSPAPAQWADPWGPYRRVFCSKSCRSKRTQTSPVGTSCSRSRRVVGPLLSCSVRIFATGTSVRPRKSGEQTWVSKVFFKKLLNYPGGSVWSRIYKMFASKTSNSFWLMAVGDWVDGYVQNKGSVWRKLPVVTPSLAGQGVSHPFSRCYEHSVSIR